MFSALVVVVVAAVALCKADFPRSPCGAPPKISGGFCCGYSQDYDGSFTYDYTCGNDCSNKVGSLVCPAGSNTWVGDVPQCSSGRQRQQQQQQQQQTSNSQPASSPKRGRGSPCPVNIPDSRPYSREFGTSKCNNYPDSSQLLCRKGVTGVKVLPTSISQVLQAHNCWRHNVKPPAAEMPDLKWDNELAALAERWAAKCPSMSNIHTPGEVNFVSKQSPNGNLEGVGQNYAGIPEGGSWAEAVDMWASERKDWQYGQEFNFAVGHWTQVIWANTRFVGCARVQCPDNELIYYFCNYAPAGNWMDQQPYQVAE